MGKNLDPLEKTLAVGMEEASLKKNACVCVGGVDIGQARSGQVTAGRKLKLPRKTPAQLGWVGGDRSSEALRGRTHY